MDMFCKDWFSIAMGNGCQDLKDIASYVPDTNVNDGIKKACEHFEWIYSSKTADRRYIGGKYETFKIREDTMDRIIGCQCNVCEFMQPYGIGSSKRWK